MALMRKFLSRVIKDGELTVFDAGGHKHVVGVDDGSGRKSSVRLADRGVITEIIRRPKLGIGETYTDGRLILEEGDILQLLELVASNALWENGGKARKAIGKRGARSLGRWEQFNWERRSKRNVAHHYDLSDRLYDLFLDADRQYSCAYFKDPGIGLEQAQADKKEHIAAKLMLKPGQRVLDIGCGWGGLALYLNAAAGVEVLGVTLSGEQLKIARQRAEDAGVADRVKFELIDYRNVDGRFDRIVSVGMFEHVGPPHYVRFFNKCRSLLADDGVMLLHTIGRMGGPGRPNAWTAKYIFPGAYHPALSEIVSASEQTRMILSDLEILRLHYAYTLRHWYRRVIEHRAEIIALYDERFLRMWLFYLASTIVGFEYGGMVNYQLQYIRNRHAAPITRDYMIDDERHNQR